MGINLRNDATQDNAQSVDAVTAVVDDDVAVTDIYDLKQADPAEFKVRITWLWTAPAPGAYQIFTVLGSTTADFSSNVYILDSTFCGDPSGFSGATGGVQASGTRGTGSYVLHCGNVAAYTDEFGANFSRVACRYIRVVVSAVGTGSAGVFSCEVEQR